MKTVPVIAFKNKSKENRFLAFSMDHGDWDDPELDVSLDDIENGFLIWRKDLEKPTEEDLENVKEESARHKKHMLERFGKNAIVSYDVEEWLKYYEPFHLEITEEQFEIAKDNAEL